MTKKHIGASYIRPITSKEYRDVVLPAFFKLIADAKVDFDTVVFTGVSGCLVGPQVATEFDKEMLLVRKTGDGNHSGAWGEGNGEVKQFIIVDDLISSGATIERVLRAMKENLPNAVCVGVFLYNDGGYSKFEGGNGSIPIYSQYVGCESRSVTRNGVRTA